MKHLTPRHTIFDNFFDEMMPTVLMRPLHGDSLPNAGQIKIDVSEKEDTFYVNAEIPGVAKEDIDLSIVDEMVTISANIEQHDEHKDNGKVLRSERYFGSVSRSFQLPSKVKIDEAEATYENGILKLVLPKDVATQSKKLTIK